MIRQGMTLVEVLVSLVILGLIVGAIFATFSLSEKGTGKLSILNTRAVNYARETLEELRNAVSTDPARSAPLSAGAHSDDLPDNDFKTAHNATRTYDATDIDSDGDGVTDYKKVTVTVKWKD